MKRIIAFLTVFLLVFTLWGQEITFVVDGRNALFGSDKNSPGLNWKFIIKDNLNYNSKFNFGMEYEAFDLIDYQQWTFGRLGYELPVTERIALEPVIAVSQIYHETSYSHDAMSYGFCLGAYYFLSERMGIVVQIERERATDISQTWRDSGYIGITYKLK